MFPGNVDAYLANVEERREHDRRVNATTLAKRRQLETFIAKNRAKASTASQARSKAKQLDRLQADRHRRAGIAGAVPLSRDRAAARPGRADRAPGDRLSRPHRRPRRARRDRSRLAGRRRGRQRPGQDDVPADRLRLARSRSPATSLGATAARSASTPSTFTRTLPEQRNGAGISRTPGRAAHHAAAHQGRGRQLPVQRRDGREENPRPQRRRTGPAGARRPAAEAAQRAGARRTGQPPRRRIGRGAGRGAHRATRAR